jgi:DedD protein
MDEGAKRRLVGAAVIVALIVIFVPMMFDKSDRERPGEPIVIPDEPAAESAAPGAAGDSEKGHTAGDLIPPLPTPEPPPGAVVEPPRTAAPASPSARAQTQSAAPTASGSQPDLVPAGPKPVPAGTMSWVVQVASLGSPDAARKLQNRLRTKGYTAFVEQAVVNGKQYYRVRVGPEVERARADSLAARLQSEVSNKPLVQRYP